MMTIAEFCDKHNACSKGREWALCECKTMDDVWRTAKPEWLLWVATRQGVLDDVTLRMFAVECARSVQHMMTDERSIAAIDVAERYALGEATDAELSDAGAAAGAASDAAWAAARAAAWAAEKEKQAKIIKKYLGR